ncbi:DUF222 domain-containing protein [Actinopolymorpha rutila]|uniref:DUF222 domain-containing protein n=1 Tax=Actinopolymorpha rutila TaxID=446787 RepID=A0A852ZCD5_9ACTN|nr:DUF222 domain-containing protein [Actinopolymorpha rutila]NYH89963.1 hypothetical protein [Actinopolymorpha rutila]
MHSTTQGLPGAGGSGAAVRLKAALATIRAGVNEALSTPTTCVEVGDLGELIGELEAEKARTDALTLAWVRQAEAGDIGKTTGAATAAAWLRTVQRMSKTEASATVGLARDLDRTVTMTARALARGELSLKHAQVIAFAVKDLPTWIGPEQRVKAEEYLIAWSRRRNPDDVRLLGRALLQVLAPEEWERRLGKELGDAERAAERKRSLRYLANGIPGSETVVIKLPVVEMETLRKLIEALSASDTRPDPDDRPLDQRRGDAFAELLAQWAQQQASPNRGRGRDCVTVTVGVDQLLTGLGYGTIDDLNPVRPTPCHCQTPTPNARPSARPDNRTRARTAPRVPSPSKTSTARTQATPSPKLAQVTVSPTWTRLTAVVRRLAGKLNQTMKIDHLIQPIRAGPRTGYPNRENHGNAHNHTARPKRIQQVRRIRQPMPTPTPRPRRVRRGRRLPPTTSTPTTAARSVAVVGRPGSSACAANRSQSPPSAGWRATPTSSPSSSAATAKSSTSEWPTGSSPRRSAAHWRSGTGPTVTSRAARFPSGAVSPTT